MTCPSCQAEMKAQALEGQLGTSVTVDLCLACQMFWFDPQESLRLSPAATLKLFKLIGEHRQAPRPPSTGMCACPKCHARLRLAHDIQRNTRFQYLRCPLGHGRLITFFEFLREKDFIRPLSAAQVEELRRNVQSVNCSNCGAPIDLASATACTHCGSPLSMLDMQRAGALVDELQRAGTPRPIDPTLPFQMARARMEVAESFAEFERMPGWFGEVQSIGLVGAGLTAISRWLKSA